MSHTNTTTNYGLPQFLSSDKPAWMADINVAFSDIDGQMKTNADAASAAQTTADNAVLNGAPGYSNLSTYAVGDVVNYLGRVYKCDIAVTTPEAFDNAKWSYYRLSDASSQLDVIDSEIGSTDISAIGDGTLTGAISDVNINVTSASGIASKRSKYKIVSMTFGGPYYIGSLPILTTGTINMTSLLGENVTNIISCEAYATADLIAGISIDVPTPSSYQIRVNMLGDTPKTINVLVAYNEA